MASLELIDGQVAVVPETGNANKLRACLVCSLVKSPRQFVESGCENCPFLNMVDDNERVYDCTTAAFDGFVAITKPSESWMARWQRLGVYAITTRGEIPEDVITQLEENGVRIPR